MPHPPARAVSARPPSSLEVAGSTRERQEAWRRARREQRARALERAVGPSEGPLEQGEIDEATEEDEGREQGTPAEGEGAVGWGGDPLRPLPLLPTSGFALSLRTLFSAALLVCLLTWLLILGLMVLTLLLGIADVLPNLFGYQDVLFLFLPLPIGLLPIEGELLVLYYLIIVLAIVVSFATLLRRQRRWNGRLLRRALQRIAAPPLHNDNAFFVTGCLFLATYSLTICYFVLLNLISVNPSVPAFDEQPRWEQLYGFARASVWEEVAGRIALIAGPILFWRLTQTDRYIIDLVRDYPTTLREVWLEVRGGKRDHLTFNTGLLVLASGLIFALAHVPGWDAWKIVPVFVSGIALGYLFVRHGLYAAILVHFSFDYLDQTTSLFVTGWFGDWVYTAIWVTWLVVGGFLFLYWARRFALGSIQAIRGEEPAPAATRAQPGRADPLESGLS